ncbi:MAG: class C sortase [Clostridiales bacterium]|nr:class C sortase [Clostridiales bacterium]
MAMKKRWVSILLVLVLLAGAGILLYPLVSDYLNQLEQNRAIESYNQSAEANNRELFDSMFASADNFNQMLYAKGSIAQLSPEELQSYHSILNPKGNGDIGYVTIPKINVNLIIGHTVDTEVLRTKAGHMEGSSFPVPGENVHAVLSAHRGLPSASLFSDLDQMEVGDSFSVHVLDKTLEYRVVDIFIVLPEETEKLSIVPGKNYVTLMTCTPYGVNTHRMLVRGELVSESLKGDEETEPDTGLDAFLKKHGKILIPGAAAALILLFLILLLPKRRGKK